MVKGKGGKWEERTDGAMKILCTIYLKCAWRLAFTHFRFSFSRLGRCKPLLHDAATTQAAGRQYLTSYANTYSVSYSYPQPLSPNSALDSTVPLARNPFPFAHKPNPPTLTASLSRRGWGSWRKIA